MGQKVSLLIFQQFSSHNLKNTANTTNDLNYKRVEKLKKVSIFWKQGRPEECLENLYLIDCSQYYLNIFEYQFREAQQGFR